MDRLAQSPLQLPAGFGDTKLQRAKLKCLVNAEDELKRGAGRKRRLQPLPASSSSSQETVVPPTEKARKEFEAALLRRDFQQVLWMIENGDVPATYETHGGETALLAAIGARNTEAFRLVMQWCVVLGKGNINGSLDLINVRGNSGVSINGRNRHGYTPLMKAIAAAAPFAEASGKKDAPINDKKAKRKLLVLDSSRSIPSNNREDHAEEAFDNSMVVSVLVHNPDFHLKDAAGSTAFDWATRTRNKEALALLEAHQQKLRMEHADFDDRDLRLSECVALLHRHDALASEMEALLRKPLLQENDLVRLLRNCPSDIIPQAVADAVQDYDVISTDKAIPFVQDYFMYREIRDGWTPLTKAAACGFVDAALLLLDLGADPSYETARLKHTALTWASYCGHEGVVLALLRVPGLGPHQQTREGKTALMHAVANKQLKIVRHLLRAMHERSVRRAGGKEAFHYNERAILQQNSPTRRPSRWGKRPVSTASGRRKPGTEEWHEVFLEMLLAQDSSGRDVMVQAREQEEDDEVKKAIQEELQHAFQQAQDHAAYVATHRSRTMPTACRFAADGCDFVVPLDLLPTHELHECTKRRVDCERCGDAVPFESRDNHDRLECVHRLVPCVNRQHGCELRVSVHDSEAHARDHCRKRLVLCRLGCDSDGGLKYDERDHHETSLCVLRLVECPLRCGAAPFQANQSGYHKRKVCTKRLVKCTGGKIGAGGCGMEVPVDRMDFHVVSLCEKRRIACQWANHGCTASIGGAADSRRHHEDAECPFRLVACKNKGCALSGQLLACFLDEHYAWQCTVEPKPCPFDCAVGSLPAHLMDAHTQSEAGDCEKRLTRCRIDLCGKTLRLYDSETTIEDLKMTSDGDAAPSARVSMRGLRQRLDRVTVFLDKLRQRHERSAGDEVTGEPGFWRLSATRELILRWLEPLHASLQEAMDRVQLAKHGRAVRVRVLSFNEETQLHLLEFQRDGHSGWIDLRGREYDVELPSGSVNAPASNSAAMGFRCEYVAASQRSHHEKNDCELRLVPCPLSCGQRLTAQSISQHLAKRCNLRNAKCRLGCGAGLPFLSLGEHEDTQCELRQVHCDHCRVRLPHRSLAVHVAKHCPQVPRRCRLGCSAKIATAQFEAHEAHECPKRLVPCGLCEKLVWYSEKETHAAEECVLRVFGPCDAGCGVELRVNQRAHHLLYDCAMRELPCPQCHQLLRWRDLAQHKQMLCRLRDVFCRRGCGVKLKELDMASHEEHACEKRIVFCGNRCGDEVAFSKMHEHLSLQCSMRVVACPHGCGDQLFAYQCETHWKRCRQRLCACGAGATHCKRPIRLWIAQRRLVRCKSHGETGLLWALKTQDEELVAYFVQAIDHDDDNSGLHTEFSNGFFPLGMAASLGNVEIAKTLLRVGADVNQETSRGRTPLMEATMARDPAMVELLLVHRASVGHVNRHGLSVLSVAESFAASEPIGQSNSKRVLTLLKGRQEMENDQRALFRAIACSDYDYVANLLKYSSGVTATGVAKLRELEQQVEDKQYAFERVQTELDDSVKVLNESIADTEAKTTHTLRMRERVDDCKSRISKIESFHETSVAASNALEAEMLAHIREITALDIAKLLNVHTPPEEYLVVMKSICMFCGVMPRGRRDASEYTDLEWWKTAQALLMDRTLLSKLRGYRSQNVTPDVMTKVRRECMRTSAFAATTKALAELAATPDEIEEPPVVANRLPRRDALRGNIVGILATWVQGVEIEYKAKSERQTLTDKKRRLGVSLNVDEVGLQHASFEMQVATRSLPARQEEVQTVQAKMEAAQRELFAATQRVRAYKLLQYAALNGHTALSFASAVGNEAMVYMLLTHGASGGPLAEELEACAALIQLSFREFVYQTKQKKNQQARSRSDAAIEALVRNVAQTFLLSHYRRKRRMVLLTHRVPMHEAVYNGHPQIVEILLGQGAAKLWHKTHIFPIRVPPGATTLVRAEPTSANYLRRRGGWTLVPLTGARADPADPAKAQDEGVSLATVDPRLLEQRLAPMTIEDTLSHALATCDSRIFLRARGGWNHDQTRYSETKDYLSKTLGRLRETQDAQRREVLARNAVAKKTQELKPLHAQLEVAIVKRDFHAVSALLDAGAFADFETARDGITALMAACLAETYVENADGSRVLAVSFLLDRQTNRPFVNFETSTGRTALGVAASSGTTFCAQELVERGASVNQQTRLRGETALMVAASHGQTAFLTFLLHINETDVLARDATGRTALDHARREGFYNAQWLLGAAMSGGNRGRVFSSESALYEVCKWGCGFMGPSQVDVVSDTMALSVHEDTVCPKRIVSCPQQCDAATLWAESVADHVRTECPLRLVRCPQPKCGSRVVASRLETHARGECDFRSVLCACGERMTHQKHVLHAQHACPQRLVECPHGCGAGDVLACDLKTHVRSECPLRRVRCRNGCVATELLAKDRDAHETDRCALRRVRCKWGCDETTVLAHAQPHHESDECLLRELACPAKCGRTVRFLDLEAHAAGECARRPTVCPRGCGRKVALHTMASHLERDCRKRLVVCSACGASLHELELASHLTSQCTRRLTSCGLCGQSDLPHAELATHRRDQCRMRVVACRFGCFAATPLLAHAQRRHESVECAWRPALCPLSCGATFVAHTLRAHERQCAMRIVACALGCGAELREQDRHEHETTHCPLKKRR